MRATLIAGNWKMHGSLSENAKLLLEVVKGAAAILRSRQAVCVPFPYLGQAQDILSSSEVALGAQNVSQHAKGAFTGEVSGAMLREFGCTYVIVGHSERRTLFGEDSETVALKFQAALDVGLTPILCVGETLSEREANATESVVESQLQAVLAKSGVKALERAVVAYEPVWAIGTGKTATPEQAQAVHAHLRKTIGAQDTKIAAALPILYGGSVKASNASDLFAMPDIDGGLIGGASLNGAEFIAICEAAAR